MMDHDSPWYRVLRTSDGRLRVETYAPIRELPADAARRLADELQPAFRDLARAAGGGGDAAGNGGGPDDGGGLSIVAARSELVRRWAERVGGPDQLPPEAGSVVFTLLAAALEPERASRRFIADWYLRTAQESLEQRDMDAAGRRRLFTALVHETWAYLQSSSLAPEQALLVGSSVERRLIGALPEYGGPNRAASDGGG